MVINMRRLVITMIILLLFFFRIILGYIAPLVMPSMAREMYESVRESIRRVLPGGEMKPSISLVMLIFLNNLRVAILSIILGPTIVIPSLIIMVNGFVLGLVASLAIGSGINIITVVLAILPHGIFELPALIYSAVVGTELGIWIIQKVFFKKGRSVEEILIGLVFSITIIAVLLLTAAFIETFVTPAIVAMG
ncbi:protein of unknown function DUF95 transmembrane [Ignisphaera aggregans DSM 17230]|uniref:Stage II sporulation protein M n=1 Tax=Ignisphaera aggregans (strain DSM 17230 / JCM 13409 / AQ1.S1) TaxID=583356 RepID=E0SQ39_IGNAA|nr:protein of unknown function DUF95 transmembrane [Ignisphaera aggregans DSM 17230]